ncbi:YheC/YheD family endospore coat-associated protein [Alkalihalobacterium bogoriense]|uniref:YheC/YheD family endospore coat-associated protein n=1 Tax=Alkalihalobacterium bogoriense TaxID=246272 RepID=UPI000A824E9A|nr:YheC/YheD family protein [Alkalihalobacterium bogoriense]
MEMKPLYIRKKQESTKTFYVPEQMFRKWVSTQQFPSELSFGSQAFPCRVAPHPELKDEFLLSSDLWEMFHIPHEQLVYVIENQSTLYLGPLVGIFTAGFVNSPLRPLGERSMFFAKLLLAERQVGSYYFVFGHHHINWEQATIDGFFYTEEGWKQVTVPFPNVIYDRLPNRKTENLETFKEIKDNFQKNYLIPWFNPGFFDKWEVHQKLVVHPETKPFMPESILNPTTAEIEALLKHHSHVYCKPTNGSLGLGIHQIIKLEDEPYYYCRFRDGDTNRLRRYSSLERLVKKQFPDGFDRFIVQQGIHLLKYKNNPVDFRIHTNKDQFGKWQVSALAAKIAGIGSVTTHIKSGGEIKSISEALQETHITKKQLEQLKSAALTLSEKLDSSIDGFIGEIGFDLGLDQDGHIWMFEANSKPGRTIFKHKKMRYDDLLSRQLPLSYAVYLANESITKPDRLFQQ